MLISISINDLTKTYCVRCYHSSFNDVVFQSLEFPDLNSAKVFKRRVFKCISTFIDDGCDFDIFSFLQLNNLLALKEFDFSDFTLYHGLSFHPAQKSHRVIDSTFYKGV